MRISDWSADVCSSDLDGMVSNMFGYHAIQIGLPHWDLLQANRIPYKWAAHGTGVPIDASGGRIVCDSEYRSAERSVGKECVSTCRSRWSTYRKKKKNIYVTVTLQPQYNHIRYH